MTKDLERIRELQDKLFQEFCYPDEVHMTESEWQELVQYERARWGNPNMDEIVIGEMLVTSHPGYGKPDKNGLIKII